MWSDPGRCEAAGWHSSDKRYRPNLLPPDPRSTQALSAPCPLLYHSLTIDETASSIARHRSGDWQCFPLPYSFKTPPCTREMFPNPPGLQWFVVITNHGFWFTSQCRHHPPSPQSAGTRTGCGAPARPAYYPIHPVFLLNSILYTVQPVCRHRALLIGSNVV